MVLLCALAGVLAFAVGGLFVIAFHRAEVVPVRAGSLAPARPAETGCADTRDAARDHGGVAIAAPPVFAEVDSGPAVTPAPPPPPRHARPRSKQRRPRPSRPSEP